MFTNSFTLKWSASAWDSELESRLPSPDDRITQAMAYVVRLAIPVAAYLTANVIIIVHVIIMCAFMCCFSQGEYVAHYKKSKHTA